MNTFLLILSLFTTSPTNDERVLVNNMLAARTTQCWTLDRQSNKDTVSVAATGVGFVAYAKAYKFGLIDKDTSSKWIRTGFDNLLRANAGNDGWMFHFLSSTTGKPTLRAEVSTIDTTLLYLGVERAANIIQDEPLLRHIRECKRKIRLDLVTTADGYVCHGFIDKVLTREYIPWKWKNYSEGVLIYKYFNLPFKPRRVSYELPLFCYYYPLAFYPREKEWKLHLEKAIQYQIKRTGRYGYSAIDGEIDYMVNSPFYISPLAVTSTKKFFPLQAERQLGKFKCDGLTPSVSVDGSWQSKERLYLDDGITLLILGDD